MNVILFSVLQVLISLQCLLPMQCDNQKNFAMLIPLYSSKKKNMLIPLVEVIALLNNILRCSLESFVTRKQVPNFNDNK
jgi:hypothetical protein